MTLISDDLEATRARVPGDALPPPSNASMVVEQVRPRERRKLPDDIADLAGVAILSGIALYGFQSSFGGFRYLLVSLAGLAAGLAIAAIGARRRFPSIVLAACTIVAYLLLSGAAQPQYAIAKVLPSPTSVSNALRLVVFGWARLLSTRPPVGTAGGLQAVGLLCGLLAGVIGHSIARRTRSVAGALAAPVVVLALGILFGTARPVSLVVQGALFAAVAIRWISARRTRERAIVHGSSQLRQLGFSLGLLAIVATGAYFASSFVPFASTNQRFTLRDRAEPPFDPLLYPSPLNGFRQYRANKKLRDHVFFKTTGLPEGGRLRLAVMDDYDGLVWLSAGSPVASDPVSGNFERVGRDITPGVGQLSAKANDPVATVTIEFVDPVDPATTVRVPRSAIWVPTVGSDSTAGIVKSIAFDGKDKVSLEDQFRFNKATGTGVATGGMHDGDRIIATVGLPKAPTDEQLKAAKVLPAKPSALDKQIPESILKKVTTYLSGPPPVDGTAAPTALPQKSYQQLIDLRNALVDEGSFSDGGEDGDDPTPFSVVSGHSSNRLEVFLSNKIGIVGNYEQYAATYALMVRNLGMQARVVMGFVPKGSGNVDVKGKDAQAWVEVNLDGLGWIPIDTTPKEDKLLKDRPPVKRNVPNLDVQPPPPTSVPQADASAAGQLDKNKKDEEKKKDNKPLKSARGFSRLQKIVAVAVGAGDARTVPPHCAPPAPGENWQIALATSALHFLPVRRGESCPLPLQTVQRQRWLSRPTRLFSARSSPMSRWCFMSGRRPARQ
jgi:hypothetical protein